MIGKFTQLPSIYSRLFISVCLILFSRQVNGQFCSVQLFGNVQTNVTCRGSNAFVGVANTQETLNYTFIFNDGVSLRALGGPLVGNGGGLSISSQMVSSKSAGSYIIEARNGNVLCGNNGIYVYYGNIDDLSITSWGGNSVSFKWAPCGRANYVEYEYAVSTQADPSLVPSTDFLSTFSTSATVGSLTNGTLYYIHVRILGVYTSPFGSTEVVYNCSELPWSTIYFTNCAGSASIGNLTAASDFICTNGTTVLTASGGSSYQWFKDGVIIPSETTATYTVLQKGNYSVRITTGAGCGGMAYSKYIYEKITSTGNFIGGGNYCLGDQVTLKIRPTIKDQLYVVRNNGVPVTTLVGIGAINESFATDDTLRFSFAITNLSQAGTYSISTSNGFCPSVVYGNVSVNLKPTATPTLVGPITQPACPTPNAGSFTFISIATGPLTYQLLNSAGSVVNTSPNGSFTGVAPGTYTVTATNSCNVSAASLPIIISLQPVGPTTPVIIGVQPTCTLPGSVTVSLPIAGLTYNLMQGASTISSNPAGIFPNVPAGTYTVTATNACGTSSASNSVTITSAPSAPVAPVITATQPTCTLQSSVTVSSLLPGLTYNLLLAGSPITSNTSGSFPNVVAGTYTVTATNACGTSSASNTVTITSAPSAPVAPVITATQPTCVLQSSVTVSLPIAGLTYNLMQGASTITSNPAGIFPNVPAGTYTVTATNGCGTSSTSNSVTITSAPSAPVAPVITATQPTCTLQSSVTVSSPMAGLTYNLMQGASIITSNPAGSFPNVAAGTYSVSATNACGTSSASNTVTISSAPSAPVAPVITATQPTCTLQSSVTVSLPIAGLTYNLMQGASTITSNPAGSFPNVAAGTYTVTATNACGTSGASNAVVITAAPASPTALVITATQPTCSLEGSVTVTSPIAGLTYNLLNGGTSVSNNTTGLFLNVTPGTYTVTATNACGTSAASNTVVITAAPSSPVAPVITEIQPTCSVQGSITVSSPIAGLTYNLMNGGTSVANNTTGLFLNVTPGTYTVTATNPCGTSGASNSVVITAAPASPNAPVITATQPSCSVQGSITVSSPIAGLTYNLMNSGTSVANNTTGLFLNVTPGTYTVTATNACGTSGASNSLVITAAPASPNAPVITATQPTCSLQAFVTVNSPIAGLTYNLINGGTSIANNTTGLFVSVTPGIYTVTATNPCGTSGASNSVVITAAPSSPVAPVITETQPTCSVQGSVTVSSPIAGLTYNLMNGGTSVANNTTGLFLNVTPGMYTVTATNACGTSGASNSVVITVAPASPNAPVITATQPSCSVQGSISVGPPIAGLTYNLMNGGISVGNNATGLFLNVTPGTYTVTATNACGTSAASNAVVITAAPASPATPVITEIQPTCSVQGSVTVSSPIAGLTYNLMNGGTSIVNNTTGLFLNVTPGTYTVTATNACGTSGASNSVVITAAPASPNAPVITETQPTCTVQGSVTVNSPIAGLTYNLINGGTSIANNTTGLFVSVTPGIYTVTATNACGTSTASNSVVIIAAPASPATPVITETQPTCSVQGSITISSPIAGLTYNLINGGTSVANNTTGLFLNVIPGTYTVTATNACGTSGASNTVVITAAPASPVAPVITETQPTCSVQGSVTVITPVAGLTYNLINGGTSIANNTTGLFINVSPGTFTVTATNACGTSAASNAVVITAAPASPATPVITETQPTCSVQSSVTVSSPIAGVTYNLITGGNSIANNTTGIFLNVLPGTYIVTATNACGTSAASNSVVINAALSTPLPPVITGSQPSCNLLGSVSVSMPAAGILYQLNSGGTTIATNNTGIFTGLTPGIYAVIASNSCGSSPASNLISLNAPTLPNPVAVITQPTCSSPTGTITVTQPAPAPGTFYSIDGMSYANTNGVFNNLMPNTYQLTVKVGVCTSPANTIVISPAPLLNTPSVTISTPSLVVCANETISITATPGFGGTSPGYRWRVNGIIVPGQTSPTFTSVFNNNDLISVEMTSNATCLATSIANSNTLTITAKPQPTLLVSEPAAVCAPRTLDITLPAITQGSSNNLTYSYWTDAGATTVVANPSSISTNGVYFIKATSPEGCYVIKQINAAILPLILPVRYADVSAIAFIATNVVPGPRSFSNGDQYEWSPSTGLNASDVRNPVFYYGNSLEYLVKITADNGCVVTDSLLVKILPITGSPGLIQHFYVPNAWTPNGDGTNDRLKPIYSGIKELAYFRIFNRWSQLVFETKDMGDGWDGKLKGTLQPQEVFVWIATGKDDSGKIITAKGTALLLR